MPKKPLTPMGPHPRRPPPKSFSRRSVARLERAPGTACASSFAPRSLGPTGDRLAGVFLKGQPTHLNLTLGAPRQC